MKFLSRKLINYIKAKPLEAIIVFICYATILVSFISGSRELFSRLQFELSEIASCDANLFFTVGKGMAKGFKPYVDYYENKPPMIFLLSEISYLMTGGFYLVNISSFLCCVNLLAAPIGIGVVLAKRRGWSTLSTALAIVILFTSSLFLLFYAEQRSGEIMCEIFGASALLDVLFCLAFLSNKKDIKFYHPLIIVAGAFLGIAIMFKEPFILLGFFSLLFLVEKRDDIFKRVVLPCGYALITVLFILLISNSFEGYFSIYLPNMINSRVTSNNSLVDRMKDFKRLFDDLDGFSRYLMIGTVVTLFVSSVRSITMFEDEEKMYLKVIFRVIRILLPFVYLYIASLSVGLGGQYFWHHFAFALPFYYSLLLDTASLVGDSTKEIKFYPFKKEYVSETFNEFAKPIPLFSLIIAVSLVGVTKYGIKKHEFKMKTEEMKNYVIKAKEHAKYIDEILDAINEKNYLYIGFNGTDRPYCYTEHLPLGPTFVQDPDNFKKENWFTKSFRNDLNTTNVVVFNYCDDLSIKDEIYDYLNNNFTASLPMNASSIKKPASFNYRLYFRNTI